MICCVMTRLSGGPRKPVTPRHALPPGAVASCLIHIVTEVSHIEGACSPAGLRLQRRGSAVSHVHVGIVAVLRLLALVRSFAQPPWFAVSHLGRSLSRLHQEMCDGRRFVTIFFCAATPPYLQAAMAWRCPHFHDHPYQQARVGMILLCL